MGRAEPQMDRSTDHFVQGPKRRKRGGRRARREAALAYVMLAPSVVLFAIFVFFPFGKNFQLPFYRQSTASGFGTFGGKTRWVGWTQWKEVLSSVDFRHSLWVTVKFVVMTVPLGIGLGLLLAVLAHQRLRGITIFRTIFSSTVASSAAVAATVFFSLIGTESGLWKLRINGHSLLEDPTWALPALALVAVWQSLGLSFIVMSSGLQAIPDDLLEAARVDGAGSVRTFWKVTLPLLSPTIYFAGVVGLISSFKTFTEIDLLTPDGGTAKSTDVLAFHIKQEAFDNSHPGRAAVFATGLFVVVLLLTLVQTRMERRVHYAR